MAGYFMKILWHSVKILEVVLKGSFKGALCFDYEEIQDFALTCLSPMDSSILII